MSRIIEAKAVISAEDRTGKAFDSIKKHFAEIGKGAKVAKDVGQLGRQLDAAAKSMRQIQDFRATQASFAQARSTYRATQAEVGRIARQLDTARKAAAQFDGIRSFSKGGAIAQEMVAARKQVTDLERQFVSAQRAVKGAASAFEAQASALKGAKHALDGSGLSVNRLVAEESRLKAAIEGANAAYARRASSTHAGDAMLAGMGAVGRREADRVAMNRRLTDGMGAAGRAARAEREKLAAQHADEADALARARAERRRHIDRHGAINAAAAGAAGYVSVHGIGHEISDTLKAGGRYQHEVVALRNAGRTPEEMREIAHASEGTVRAVPTSTFEENLRVVNETTGAFGSLHHAIENLPFMQKSAAALHASAGDKIQDNAGELGNKLARFFEMRGTAGNTPVFQREAGEMIRAMVFTRGNFNPGEMVNFAQQAKASLPLYSERFLTKIVPSLVTEFGGDRAGTAANAFRSVVMGKANDAKQAQEWVRLGLLDPKMAVMKAGHAVSWKAGAVKDTDLALSDPLAWAEKNLIPALQKSGVNTDDKLELSKALGTLFRNSNSNLFAEAMSQSLSRNRLHKDEVNIDKSGSLDQVYNRNLKQDPTEGIKALKAGLDDLMTSVSSPLMPAAGAALKTLAEGLQSLALSAKDHPVLAAGAGAAAAGGSLAGAGWLSYQIMNGFGLGASATALDGSAGALTAAAVKLGGADVVKGLPSAGGAAAAATGGAAAGVIGATIGTAAAAAFAAYATAHVLPKIAQSEGPSAIDPATGEHIGMGEKNTTPWLRNWWHARMPTWLGGDPSGQKAAVSNTLDGAATASATAANGGKPLEATVKPDQITAQVKELPAVTGQATVTVDQHTQVDVHVDADWIKATARAEAKSAVASIPLASSGARPGAVSMPGAATTPGAR